MNAPSEDFEQLRKLLALKRHETPPPGYFTTFSTKVVARIEALEMVESRSWWQRALMGFDLRPVVASAYAVGVVGLVLVGFGLAKVVGMQQAEATPAVGSNGWLAATPPEPAMGGGLARASHSQVMPETPSVAGLSSLSQTAGNESSSSAPSFLFGPPSMRVLPASLKAEAR